MIITKVNQGILTLTHTHTHTHSLIRTHNAANVEWNPWCADVAFLTKQLSLGLGSLCLLLNAHEVGLLHAGPRGLRLEDRLGVMEFDSWEWFTAIIIIIIFIISSSSSSSIIISI